jgi:hypothetical protein
MGIFKENLINFVEIFAINQTIYKQSILNIRKTSTRLTS